MAIAKEIFDQQHLRSEVHNREVFRSHQPGCQRQNGFSQADYSEARTRKNHRKDESLPSWSAPSVSTQSWSAPGPCFNQDEVSEWAADRGNPRHAHTSLEEMIYFQTLPWFLILRKAAIAMAMPLFCLPDMRFHSVHQHCKGSLRKAPSLSEYPRMAGKSNRQIVLLWSATAFGSNRKPGVQSPCNPARAISPSGRLTGPPPSGARVMRKMENRPGSARSNICVCGNAVERRSRNIDSNGTWPVVSNRDKRFARAHTLMEQRFRIAGQHDSVSRRSQRQGGLSLTRNAVDCIAAFCSAAAVAMLRPSISAVNAWNLALPVCAVAAEPMEAAVGLSMRSSG